jgi:hypothetical protein
MVESYIQWEGQLDFKLSLFQSCLSRGTSMLGNGNDKYPLNSLLL